MKLSARQLFFVTAVLVAVVVFQFARDRERILQTKVTSWTDTRNADCAIVLTGASARIPEGFSLLGQRRVRKLIISGVYKQADLPGIFPQWPFYGVVDPNDVILEKHSLTTYGNAEQSLPIVEALRCRDVILVTSRVHMYRSLRTFRAAFPERIPIYPRAVIAGHYNPSTWELLSETFKTMFYDLWAY